MSNEIQKLSGQEKRDIIKQLTTDSVETGEPKDEIQENVRVINWALQFSDQSAPLLYDHVGGKRLSYAAKTALRLSSRSTFDLYADLPVTDYANTDDVETQQSAFRGKFPERPPPKRGVIEVEMIQESIKDYRTQKNNSIQPG